MEQFKEDVNKQRGLDRANDLNLLNMIESRIMEIIQIEDECKKKLPKLYNQRLPRFMRRRAACHNPKRLPKKLRPAAGSKYGTKDRKPLEKYRLRLRHRKHKRVLRKHGLHKFSDPFKSLLHKWFAKRFKMSDVEDLTHVPLFNNTKNQRNLYRQTRYGCAYLSMFHLIPIQLKLSSPTQDPIKFDSQLDQLNGLTNHAAGFTFCAKSLQKGRYEVAIHLYNKESKPFQYLCCVHVNLTEFHDTESPGAYLTLWTPKQKHREVFDQLERVSKSAADEISVEIIHPCDWARIKLVGPRAREEAFKLCFTKTEHEAAIEDVEMRLSYSMGSLIGRYLEEEDINFTYYNTSPPSVDLVFKGPPGRMLWHQLIKNKAHLVGGYRDLDRLLLDDSFKLIPDC